MEAFRREPRSLLAVIFSMESVDKLKGDGINEDPAGWYKDAGTCGEFTIATDSPRVANEKEDIVKTRTENMIRVWRNCCVNRHYGRRRLA